MDIDQFWQLIERARAKAGPAADQAVRDYDNPDDDPNRDYWDFSDIELETGLTSGDPAEDADRAEDSDWASGDLDDDLADGDEEVVDPVAIALVEVLSELTAAEIAAFDNLFDELRAEADREDLANAAVLIEHGFLGDDSFDDFRAGLVTLGRKTYEAALHDPDSLASHPLVREIAHANDPRWLGREDVVYAASYAYAKVTGEDEMAFYDFAETLAGEQPGNGSGPAGDAAGGAIDSARPEGEHGWEITDEALTRRWLPQLSELFYERSMRNRTRVLDKLGLAD